MSIQETNNNDNNKSAEKLLSKTKTEQIENGNTFYAIGLVIIIISVGLILFTYHYYKTKGTFI